VAKEALDRSRLFAYRDRRTCKRDFRRLWIVRINAMVRNHGMSYSQFVCAMKKSGCVLDRRSLAEIASRDPESFGEIIKAISSADKAA
jgi:large subunit ribosomal protein L20